MHARFGILFRVSGIVSQQSELCIFTVRSFGCALFILEDESMIHKKALAIVLAVLLTLPAVGCAKKAKATNAQPNATTATQKKFFYPAGTTASSTIPNGLPKSTTAPPSVAPTTVAASDGLRPEFKQAMDEYEQFFDEYCDFMRKYAVSDDSLSMIGDYLRMLEQYTQTMESLEQIGDWDLNAAERSYYAETFARIMQKLAAVADDELYWDNGNADEWNDYEYIQRQEILAQAADYRACYKEVILTVTDLFDYLCLCGYDEDLCGQICFAEGVEGFYDGAAMYDFERILMFHEQGYRREAIIDFYYYGEYSYEEVVYLVDECLAGRKLTYMIIGDEKVLVEIDEIE